jgi:hypothetical protein
MVKFYNLRLPVKDKNKQIALKKGYLNKNFKSFAFSFEQKETKHCLK